MLSDFECQESNLEKEYESLCQTNGWNILFQRIKNNASIKMMNNECLASRSNENRFKNKYREIVPYDYNRVYLTRSDLNSDYINASLVTVSERAYIVTQYPYKTRDLFWLMVWQFKSPGIIMLGKFEESELETYFPKTKSQLLISSAESKIVLFSIHTLELNTYNGFIQRKLRICDMESNMDHELWHFEFWSWPDQRAPKCIFSFLNLMGMIRQLGILDSTENPAVVHCSAGAGRSGTFCLVDLVLVEAETRGNLDDIYISEIVENLRVQRMGMVHSIAQLKFGYEAIIEAFKRFQTNVNGRSNNSYLLCDEGVRLYDNEMLYYSSSESGTSGTIYLRSSDDESENDFSYEYHPKERYEVAQELANERNTSNAEEEYAKDSSYALSDWEPGKNNLSRCEIISQRKLKNQHSIDRLSKHLQENNLKRFRFISNATTSSTLSLLEEINDKYYWSIFIVGGTICFMGACLWLKYNPFR